MIFIYKDTLSDPNADGLTRAYAPIFSILGFGWPIIIPLFLLSKVLKWMDRKLFEMIIDRFDSLENNVTLLVKKVEKLSSNQSYNNGKRYTAYIALSALISIVVVVASSMIKSYVIGV